MNPSLWASACTLAKLSHPEMVHISISAHEALQENTELSDVGARSWLTKPRGPEQPHCRWLKVLESKWERQCALAVFIKVKKELKQDVVLNSYTEQLIKEEPS